MRGEPAQLSDEALVEAVARADDDALGELYDRFGKVAYGLAFPILHDAALAEDAVQEAFLQIWRSAGSYEPERAKASTWLLTFVHRRPSTSSAARSAAAPCRPSRAASRRKREPTRPWSHAPAESSSARPSAACPRSSGRPIELAYSAASRQSELAQRLDQPLGTIKSRMFAGCSVCASC